MTPLPPLIFINDAGVIVPGLKFNDVAHRIQLAGQAFGADLVVMGTHGRRGVQRLVPSSAAERFPRIAICPVLLVSAHCPPSASVARVAGDAGDAVNEPP